MQSIQEVFWETTTGCNDRCYFCPLTSPGFEKRGLMKLDQFISLYERIPHAIHTGVSFHTFSGIGDPTVDKTLVDKMRYIRDQQGRHGHKNVGMLTNAAILRPELSDQLIGLGLEVMRFSFYGMSAKTHEKAHGKSNYHEALDNIGYYIKHRDPGRQKVMIQFLYLPENMHETSEFIDFWTQNLDTKNGDRIEVWKPHNWADFGNFRPVEKDNKASCGRVDNGRIFILANGDLSVCNFDYNGDLIIGNLHNQDYHSIMEGVPLKKIKNAHESGDFQGLICEGCDQRNVHNDSLVFTSDQSGNDKRIRVTSTAAIGIERP